MSEVLERVLSLRCTPARAFHVFTAHTDLWWPRGHRRNAAATVIFEPEVAGRLFERGPDGAEWTIGRVTTCEPPARLGFAWYPGSPAAPTAVEISFRATPDGTEIGIVHRALSAEAIAAWPGKVTLFERGWDAVLAALAKHMQQEAQA